jgi:hypothetical protein
MTICKHIVYVYKVFMSLRKQDVHLDFDVITNICILVLQNKYGVTYYQPKMCADETAASFKASVGSFVPL